MITTETLLSIAEKQKLEYFRLYDTAGNCLFKIEEAGSAGKAQDELRDALDFLKDYGKLTVQAADEKVFKGKWTGASKFSVQIGTPKANAVSGTQPPAGFKDLTGYVPQGVLDAKMENMRLMMQHSEDRMRWEREKEKSKTAGVGEYTPFIPVILAALGKTTQEISQVMGSTVMQSTAAINGTPGSVDRPTHVETAGMTVVEKNVFIEKKIQEIAGKVHIDDFILVLKALDDNKDLSGLLGVLATKVPADVLNKLIRGLINNPDMASKALAFL